MIPTAMTDAESNELRNLAKDAVVLELGAEFGHSTVLMAEVAKRVVSVDWHRGDAYSGHKDSFPEYREAIKGHSNVVPIVGSFQEILPLLASQSFDLVFIDGDHGTTAVAHDLGQALRLVKPDGAIACHDFGRFGVTDGWMRLAIYPDRVVDSLAVKQIGMGVQSQPKSPIAPIAIGLPLPPLQYAFFPAEFVLSFLGLKRDATTPMCVQSSPYVEDNMREIVKNCLAQHKEWERLVIVEMDMVLPHDALERHAMHTAPIVGSTYFQHDEPHWLNCMIRNPDEVDSPLYQPSPDVVEKMMTNPGLYGVDVVGMGCTSIRRDVLENWPENQPTFVGAWDGQPIGHDIYFCNEARKQGWDIFIDTSIQCGHSSHSITTYETYRKANGLG